MLFTDRGPFREYDVLAEALPTLGRARYVPREDVLAGRLGPHLDALLESRRAWTDQRMDGAQIVAERVLAVTSVNDRHTNDRHPPCQSDRLSDAGDQTDSAPPLPAIC